MAELSFLNAFLEDNPDILFQAMRPRDPGLGQNFINFSRGQQSNIFGDYLGLLGRGALQGEVPNTTFQSFLGNYPWLERFQSLSPTARGERPRSLFAPRLRFNI